VFLVTVSGNNKTAGQRGANLTLGKIFMWGVYTPCACNSTTGGALSKSYGAVEVQTWTDWRQMSGMLLEKAEGQTNPSAHTYSLTN
jgi:hypothetical protein